MPRPSAKSASANANVVSIGRNRAEQDKILDRATKVWELRIAGKGPAQIATILGVSRKTVDTDLRLMESRVPAISAQERRSWRMIHVNRHELVISHHLPAATGGEVEITVGEGERLKVEGYVGDLSMRASQTVLTHMQQQAKVLQLDLLDAEEEIDPDAATPEEVTTAITSLAARLLDRRGSQ